MKTFNPRKKKRASARSYLDGQFLLAMPSMPDDRFARTVIYICAHSEEGAMGIVVNQKAPKLSFPDLLVQLDVIEADAAALLPAEAGAVPVLRGGPVETGRGFVLHSGDFKLEDATLAVGGDICLTATVDILRAIAMGDGPQRAMLALGYASWSPGQLEQEISGNGWMTGPADSDIIFGTGHDTKYERAFRQMGIEPGFLSSDAGHA